jgi:anti-anti-sigma factor
MSTTISPVTALNQLHIDTTWPAPSTIRVAVVGEIDLATAPTLHDRLLTVLHEQTPAVLVVDLADVTFLDCTGIGALVAARNAAISAGAQVRVSHPQPAVRRLLDLAGLLGVLTAAIDQPDLRPARSGHRSLGRSSRATAAPPPDMKTAA